MRIKGNTIGVSNPRPDFNQQDERKADFIKNKPYILPAPVTAIVGNFLRVKSVDEEGNVTALETAEVSGGGTGGGGTGGGSIGVLVEGETLILASATVEDEMLIL